MRYYIGLVLAICLYQLASCGGDSSDTPVVTETETQGAEPEEEPESSTEVVDEDCDLTEAGTLAVEIVAADHYVKCAQFCADTNGNGACGEDEQKSTLTDENGEAGFVEEVPPSTVLLNVENSIHNGVPYTIAIEGVVPETGLTQSSAVVISPLTTLKASGLTEAQVVTMLQTAGLSEMTVADVTGNPMENIIGNEEDLSDAFLARIRASIAVYNFIRIYDGAESLKNLSASEIYSQATTGGDVAKVLTMAVTIITSALTNAVLTEVKAQAAQIPGAPAPTREDVVRTAVVISDLDQRGVTSKVA
ncbi:MAG: hypothetical protein HRU19_16305 [Pseudobacteriovorax sp.]|nr:hypothetical protein [Pseudobacteriovorax sp.]